MASACCGGVEKMRQGYERGWCQKRWHDNDSSETSHEMDPPGRAVRAKEGRFRRESIKQNTQSE
jgi:hypothetical protein